MSAPSSPPPDATTGPEGAQGYPSSDPSGSDGSGDLRAELALTLVERFRPEHLDPACRAESERVGMTVPDPTEASAMVTFVDTDGCRSLRVLTFGEIADALLAAGWRRVTEDPDEIERLAAGMRGLQVAERGVAADGSRLTPWERIGPHLRRWYLHEARLALAVLRGGAR